MAKLELPSMLNYTRSIIPSNGVFFYRDGKEEQPVTVYQQTVRGTISNYSGVYDKKGKQENEEAIAEKLLDPKSANIQRIDVCYLPDAVDHFCLRFSVTFAAHSAAPGACNVAAYAGQLEEFAQAYREKGGYGELAKRYLQNLINARWMWRNRYATNKQVEIVVSGQKPITFQVDNDLDKDYSGQAGYAELMDAIGNALSGQSGVLRLSVTGTGVLGHGQEVYPSQEFVEGKKDKTLASVKLGKDVRQAAMHSQKIGNALRTIDDWHSRASDYGKIAVEPYGVVAQRAEAVRLPNSKSDLYTYLKALDQWTEAINKAEPGQLPPEAHYMMACLIRGGVYSGGKKGS